ncbi:DUF1249 domain-containing protein [Thalassotalea sp. PLHSN55]|uniref:DUF1249 domain-containing protein n=1 Tax=Thalassotalea sp. PLHSN55 TaxID=3435888 RepID=UPI003F854BB2
MSKVTKKYRPSLTGLMNLCSVNYMLILKLLSDNEQLGERRCFFISDFLSYSITIDEITRYTSLVTMSQDGNVLGQHLDQFLKPVMVIRLYHDAQMAEVISSQDIKHIQPRYDYPNKTMRQPDEKQQTNQFLKEWLQVCHQLGQVNVALFD